LDFRATETGDLEVRRADPEYGQVMKGGEKKGENLSSSSCSRGKKEGTILGRKG